MFPGPLSNPRAAQGPPRASTCTHTMVRDDPWWPPPQPHIGLGNISDVPGPLSNPRAAQGPSTCPHTMITHDDPWWPPPHPHVALGTVSDVPESLTGLTTAQGPPKGSTCLHIMVGDDLWWPPPQHHVGLGTLSDVPGSSTQPYGSSGTTWEVHDPTPRSGVTLGGLLPIPTLAWEPSQMFLVPSGTPEQLRYHPRVPTP